MTKKTIDSAPLECHSLSKVRKGTLNSAIRIRYNNSDISKKHDMNCLCFALEPVFNCLEIIIVYELLFIQNQRRC